LGSAVAGVPFGLYVEQHASRSANVQGNLRAANERIKDTINDFQHWAKEAFLHCNEERLKKTLVTLVREEKIRRKRNRLPEDDLLMLLMLVDVEVKMECTPLITRVELREMLDDGVISMETYQRHLLRLYGLPESDGLPNPSKRRKPEPLHPEKAKKKVKVDEIPKK